MEDDLSPCIGCGKCFDSKRCCKDKDFNTIYNKLVEYDCIFFVSPHYAPISAKLSMLLEKMEEITFLHWWKNITYKSEIPYNDEWNTGISLPVSSVETEKGIFPIQRYDWSTINEKIKEYVECVVQAGMKTQ